MNVRIDQEFKSLIPPPTADEYNQLEQNIINDGIRDPLVTWNGVLIDGHNRYEIAQKHNLEFRTVEKSFDDRNEAIKWIILNQFGRRNLSAYHRSILALKLKPVIAAKAKENMLAGVKIENPIQIFGEGSLGKEAPKETKSTTKERTTNAQIAKAAGVSDETIRKVEKIQKQAAPEIIEKVQSGEE